MKTLFSPEISLENIKSFVGNFINNLAVDFFRIKRNKKLVFSVIFLFCLLVLFELFFSGQRLTRASLVNNLLNKQIEDGELQSEYDPFLTKNESDVFLGGLTDNGLSSVQSLADLSADDGAENFDHIMVQGNSIMGATNPGIINQFTGIKRDVIAYTVKAGDIPEEIAFSFGINTDTLLWANNLKNGDLIRPGDNLIILPINGIGHKVAKGDNTALLATKYGADEEDIRQFNFLGVNDGLKIGDYIIIPNGEMPYVAPKKSVKAARFVSNNNGAYTQSYGFIMPTIGFNWGRKHATNAVDIANKCGTPVYAAASGIINLVDVVGWNGGYGKYIKITHDKGIMTLYSHLSQALVQAGQSVRQGELIALMGTTGRSTGCHVHFEVRGAINPFIKR